MGHPTFARELVDIANAMKGFAIQFKVQGFRIVTT
jgi:hypothetical protein